MKLAHLLLAAVVCCGALFADTETLPPLEDGKVPATFDELWRGFDPRAEPLEIEVLDESEKDGIVFKTVRFRVGFFNGGRAMLAGIYGYPKGAKDLPGLLHIHGGGQYADWRPVNEMAKRGYAVLSVAWAGRYNSPTVKVGPEEVKLFWDGKTDDPNYHLTTDWGGVDAYHAPCRYLTNNFVFNPPSDSTIDPVKSPRNSGWFCVAMGARRALTFLENQLEVDGNRLGVFGHSMGGHLTVLTAGSDERVKAAVPSCGGITDRDKFQHGDEYVTTLGDDVYLKRITSPIVFQIPSNDFHSEINDLQLAVDEIQSDDWRMTCSPHHNHTDTAEYYVLAPLWFDQHLKSAPAIAETPESKLLFERGNKTPRFAVKPDRPDEVIELNVYYTEQGEIGNRHNIRHVVNRYWRYAKATRKGDVWYADIPTFDDDSPLWVYSNASYALDEEISGVGYGYGPYTADRYTVTSRMAMLTPEQKQAQGVAATLAASHVIEDFQGDWQKEWYSFVDKPNQWELKTHKVYSPMYRAPLTAKLVFEVRSEEVNHLAINTGKTWKIARIEGGNEWQTISLLPTDFNAHNPEDAIFDWQGMSDFKLSGSNWKGPKPEFRNLHWVEISLAEMMANRENKLAAVERVDGKVYLDIKDANVATGTWKPQMHKWLGSNQPIVHAGKTYEHGISVLPPSELNFFLGGKFERLHAEALSTHAATVEFKVYVDRELVYDSGLVNGVGSQLIDLPLTAATELQLIATDGGDGIHGDIVAWADMWVQ